MTETYKLVNRSPITSNSFIFNKDEKELLKITPIDETLTEYKIVFNKEHFPQYSTEDFAKEFIDIVEEHILKRRY